MAETIENIAKKNWVNPYVNKIGDFAGCLYPCAEEGPSEDEINDLKNRIKTADKVYVEIGSGSGGFLLKKAQQAPLSHYVGFELRFKRIVRTAEKARDYNIKNISLFKTKGERVSDIFPDASVDGLYVNFPEPWTKRKWFKHRVVSDTLVKDMERFLKPGAFFALKTDNVQYFEYTKKQFTDSAFFTVKRFSSDLYSEAYLSENIATEFEQLFRSQGLPIFFLEAVAR